MRWKRTRRIPECFVPPMNISATQEDLVVWEGIEPRDTKSRCIERNSISVIVRSHRLREISFVIAGTSNGGRICDYAIATLVASARADRPRCKSYRFHFKAEFNFARRGPGDLRDVTQNLRRKARLFTSVHFANQRPSTSSFHYPVHLISASRRNGKACGRHVNQPEVLAVSSAEAKDSERRERKWPVRH